MKTLEQFAGECYMAEAERVAKFLAPEQAQAFLSKRKREVAVGQMGLYTVTGNWTEWGAMVRDWYAKEAQP